MDSGPYRFQLNTLSMEARRRKIQFSATGFFVFIPPQNGCFFSVDWEAIIYDQSPERPDHRHAEKRLYICNNSRGDMHIHKYC